MPTIAEILSTRITKEGKSKTYVASELKVTEKTIENYMRGKREPDATTLVKLSKLLGFDMNELSEQDVPKSTSLVTEPVIEYNKTQDYGDPAFLAGQLEMAERLIARLETDHSEAKADKNKLFEALAETRQTINELLKPMVASLKEVPPVLDSIVRNSNEHDKEIMKALDHLVGNAPGTLQKEAGKRILKGALEQQKMDKKENARKQHKAQ